MTSLSLMADRKVDRFCHLSQTQSHDAQARLRNQSFSCCHTQTNAVDETQRNKKTFSPTA